MAELRHDEPLPDWTSDERPAMPGSPATLYHRPMVRAAYLSVGCLILVTYGLANGFVSADLPAIQGEFGLTPVEGTWISTLYFMMYVSANLLVFKARQQFGVQRFAEVAVCVFAFVALLHLFGDSYPALLILRAIMGLAAAPLVTLGLFYVTQAFPKARVGSGMCIALGLVQLSIPLGWSLSPFLTNNATWQPLYTFEFGLALVSMAAVFILKLPRGIRLTVFEWNDLLSYALIAPALALIVAVLGQVRTQWWSDNPWMAYALITAIILLLAAFAFESGRKNPLIQTSWLGSAELLRFLIGSFGIRFIMSEQTFAAVGVMRTLGMGPDQLQALYALIACSMVLGAVVAAFMFAPNRMIPMILAAIALIIFAGFHDGNLTSLTRPHDLYLGQIAISCAAGMFMGPLLVIGVTRAMSHGVAYMVTFAVLFGVSQSAGGLSGAAVYSIFQQYREHAYSSQMVSHLDTGNPLVASRIAAQSQALASVIVDPALRSAEGAASLAQAATQQANVRAYVDVFVLNCFVALALFAWALLSVCKEALKTRSRPSPSPAARGATQTAQ